MKKRITQNFSKRIKFIRNDTQKRGKNRKGRGLRNFKTETDLDKDGEKKGKRKQELTVLSAH